MKHTYECIRSRIPEDPKWFDEDGVPRYDAFTPRLTANIYARQSCLLLIECQNCGQDFRVAMSWRTHEHAFGGKSSDLATRVADGTIHYGDPPNIECCPAGPTMNSVPRKVLEFWRDDLTGVGDWQRVPELERDIACDWADERIEL
jgi:hypothetical protein